MRSGTPELFRKGLDDAQTLVQIDPGESRRLSGDRGHRTQVVLSASQPNLPLEHEHGR